VAIVSLCACGGGSGATSAASRRIDKAELETLLVQRQKERNPSLPVGKATCPADVAARRGETFQCLLEVEGQAARFSVTVAEIKGDKARYTFRPLQAIVDVSGVVTFIRSRLDPDWRSARIDCGRAKVRVVDVSSAIECTVFNGTATRYIQAVVEDADGTVTVRER
jgi:hypothetical protein